MVDGWWGLQTYKYRTANIICVYRWWSSSAFVPRCNLTRGGATQRRNSCSVSPHQIPLRQSCLGMTLLLFVDGNTVRRVETARSWNMVSGATCNIDAKIMQNSQYAPSSRWRLVHGKAIFIFIALDTTRVCGRFAS